MSEDVSKEIKSGVTVIIPVYNGEKTLAETLHSVSQFAFSNYEIVVVDDASTDSTGKIAEEHGARVIRLDHNSGPATARNEGANHAQYDTLLFTDSDVWVSKQLLNQLIQIFHQTHADAVQGSFSEVCPYPNYFSQYKNLYNRFVLNALPDWIDTTFTSITAVKRDAFLKCGGFDEHIRTASVEDRTLGKNLTDHGYRIYFAPSLEVIHNKKLTLWGFIRNQFYRSRDLVKLMLRNRSSSSTQLHKAKPNEDNFGTNAPSTMARLPVVYLILFMFPLLYVEPNLWVVLVFLFGFFFYFIFPFKFYLLKKRGFLFSLMGIPANFIDAFVSGLGVMTGIIEFVLLGRKY